MSKTVVYDQHENTKRIMNAINAFARRCRIGKVKRKNMITGWQDGGVRKATAAYPPMSAKINETGYVPKCGCKIGSACNNAACPHAAYVTC